MAPIDAALQYARDHRNEHLEQFKELLGIPSISTLSEHTPDMLHAAERLAGELRGLGMNKVEIMPTGRHPVVYGEWLGAPGKPTVLVYGHYDVQPVDPVDEWDTPPFEPTVKGDYVHARGASDMKGQIFAQLKGMEALARNGGFPVNVKYLIEGEEEIGSPSLEGFIDEHKELLACDVVLNCDGGIYNRDTPAITYALRGLAYFELEVRGPRRDLHSGVFGGAVLNPIQALCDLVAGMHDGDGRVTLPGFYDAVRPLEADERSDLGKLPYSDAEWLEMTGAPALWGEAGYTTLERVGARPTLEVNGIWGGFTGEGSKTVLPAVARAKISMRLVADQKPGMVEEQLRGYMEERALEGVTWSLRRLASGPGSIMDRRSPAMRSAVNALRTVFGKEVLFKREGGSIPVVGLLQEKLGVDTVLLGFELPDDGIHGPNERQYIPNFYRAIETYIHFLTGLSA